MDNPGLFICLGTVVLISAVLGGLIAPLRKRRAWKTFATQAGLTYKHRWLPGDTHLSGNYRGRQIEIETFCVGDKYSSSTTYVGLTLKTNKSVPTVVIRPFRKQLIKRYFINKEEIGLDEDFYQRFSVQTDSKQFAATLLASTELRRHLYQTILPKMTRGAGDSLPEIRINSQRVEYKQRLCYALRRYDELDTVAKLLTMMADDIEALK